jgi:hypothetical protein
MGLALAFTACRQTVVFDQSGFEGGVVDGSGDGGQTICTGPPAQIIPEYPEVFVALDRSAGMNGRFGDTTELMAARDALDVQVAPYQKAIHFGYVEFPSPASSNCPQGECCAGNVSSPNPSFLKFNTALHACDANQSCASSNYSRPTWPALTSTLSWFNQREPIHRYVLLITNGQPDCGGGTGFGDCQDTENVISQLAGLDVTTHVVVPAPPPLDTGVANCMTMLALAGNAPTPQPYYQWATDPAALSSALGAIARAVATDACQVDVLQIQAPIDPDRGSVQWMNIPIPRSRNGSDGWEIANNGFDVKLRGQWCDRLIQDGPDAFAVFPVCSPRH